MTCWFLFASLLGMVLANQPWMWGGSSSETKVSEEATSRVSEEAKAPSRMMLGGSSVSEEAKATSRVSEEAKAPSRVMWGGSSATRVVEEAKSQVVVGSIEIPGLSSNCSCVAPGNCLEKDVVNYGQGNINVRVGKVACPSTEVCCLHPQPVNPLTTWPSNPECGKSKQIRTSSVNGNRAAYGEFPWMVALLEKTGGGLGFLCGGTLINPQVVLTAAHCIHTKTAGNLVVRVGEYNAANTNEEFPSADVDVKKIRSHPDYYAPALFNDIGLLFLTGPTPYSPVISLSCLPSQGYTDTYQLSSCVTTGWGKQEFTGGYSAYLRKVDLPIVPRSTCQADMQGTNLGAGFRLHESFLCAGGKTGDACTGDGGGPLLCPLSSSPSTLVQVGVVSWGKGCGDVPGVYTDVSQFTKWITDNVVAELGSVGTIG